MFGKELVEWLNNVVSLRDVTSGATISRTVAEF
jgi:hypothetical protein